MDNCRVHHSKLVEATANGLLIELIWLRPYSPQLNAIELLWAVVKSQFKKDLLEAQLHPTKRYYVREILAPILNDVKPTMIQGFCNKAIREILNF